VLRGDVLGKAMAVTDLKAHPTSGATETDTSSNGLSERLTVLEAEFRLLREECVRTRKLIEDRETRGRTLMDAYKQVTTEFTNLFEAQRKESLKREESIRFLLTSIESRIRSEIERNWGDEQERGQSGSRGLFRRRSAVLAE
jgi:hypothetical protein